MAQGQLSLILACLTLSACSGETRQVNSAQGFQQGQPGQTSYATAPPPAAVPPPAPVSSAPPPGSGTQPLGAVQSDPNMLQSIIAGALAGGAASLSILSGGEREPIEQGIKAQASSRARGMKPEGQLMTARLQQDGHAEGTFTLVPGKCYSVVGFAGFGVFNYQINVLTAPPTPPSVLAQSGADGVVPVVGPNEQCLKNPYPLPMQVKIDMHVLRGTGLVGAQVYKK